MTTPPEPPGELVALRHEAATTEGPFFADKGQLGDWTLTLTDYPSEVLDYVSSPAGRAYERFFADVLWIGVDDMGSGMLGYWKGDADTFAGAPVVRVDGEGRCTTVAARLVDRYAGLVDDDTALRDFCRRAGLEPPAASDDERDDALSDLPDAEDRWDELISAEWNRLDEDPVRPMGYRVTTVTVPAGVVVLSHNDEIPRRGNSSNAAFLVDPATGSCTLLPPLSRDSSWYHHAAGALPDGRAAFLSYQPQRRCDILDPATATWHTGAVSELGLTGGSTTVLPDGRVLVIGGSPGRNQPPSASCEVYDPGTDTWTVTGDLPVPRDGGMLRPVEGGALLVAGTEAYRYDLATCRWTAAAPPPVPVAEALPGTPILVSGAAGWATYDGNAWTVLSPTPPPAGAPVRLDATRVAYFGDEPAILDVATGARTPAAATLLPRADSTPVLLPTGAVLLVGGYLFRYTGKEPELWQPSGSTALPGLEPQLERHVASLATWRTLPEDDRFS